MQGTFCLIRELYSQAGRDGWLFVLGWDIDRPGGVSQVVDNLFTAVQRHLGRWPVLLVKSWEDPIPRRNAGTDGRSRIFARLRTPWDSQHPARSALGFLLALPRYLSRLRRILSEERIATINVHFPELDALTWVLLKWLLPAAPRLILSFHGVDVRPVQASRGISRFLWKRLLRSADAVTASSQEIRTILENGGFAAHVHVLDNGVDAARVAAAAQGEPGIVLPADFIASLGTFEHKKGHDVLIRAFAQAARGAPQLSLVIAGRVQDASYLASLAELCASLDVADRVHFLKDLDHQVAMRVLGRVRAFVLASRQEPFGIAILEAGVLRKAVIATDRCGAAQRMTPGVELLTVPADNAEALADALRRLLEEPGLSERLANALAQRVTTDFSWERVAREYGRLAGVGS